MARVNPKNGCKGFCNFVHKKIIVDGKMAKWQNVEAVIEELLINPKF